MPGNARWKKAGSVSFLDSALLNRLGVKFEQILRLLLSADDPSHLIEKIAQEASIIQCIACSK